MTSVKLQFEALPIAQDNVRKCIGEFTENLSALNSALRPTLEAWAGDSSSAMQGTKARWDQQNDHLQQVANRMAAFLNTSHGDYLGMEQANASRFA